MSPPFLTPSQDDLVPQRPDTSLEYVPRLSEVGTQRSLSGLPGAQQEIESTMSTASSFPARISQANTPDTTLSTLESPPPNRKLIWNVRSSLSLRNSPNIGLYETSARELIGEDPVLKPFFDTAWKGRYESLWSLTETGYQDWDSSSSNFSLRNQAENSWFWIKEYREKPVRSSEESLSLERTSYPSFTFSPPDTTDPESTNEEPPRKRQRKSAKLLAKGAVLRARRMRILPTTDQRKSLRDCFGIYRHIYNECVSADKKEEVNGASAAEMRKWRTLFTRKDNYYGDNKPWKDNCPCHTKQQAVEEYFKAKKTAVGLLVKGKLPRFDMKFKSRFKAPQETVPFESYRFSNFSKWKSSITIPSLKIGAIRTMGKVPREFSARKDEKSVREEMKITRTKLGKYYATITYEVQQEPKYAENKGDVISFDPGCKTFQSYHSNDGSWGEIGKFDQQQALLQKADKLSSKLSTTKRTSAFKRRLRRRILGLYEKVRNRTADLHNKVCSWVVSKYRIILLPTFESSKMVSSLQSKTARSMMTWSHFKFQRKLLAHAQKFTDVKVRLVNESFTTKTCGSCGVLNDRMTLSNRTFWCDSCGLKSPRDGHASRNIGLRALKYILV